MLYEWTGLDLFEWCATGEEGRKSAPMFWEDRNALPVEHPDSIRKQRQPTSYFIIQVVLADETGHCNQSVSRGCIAASAELGASQGWRVVDDSVHVQVGREAIRTRTASSKNRGVHRKL